MKVPSEEIYSKLTICDLMVANEEVYLPRRQQYKHYNDNEHAKTDMYIEH